MKWVLIGSAVLVVGIAASLLYISRRKSAGSRLNVKASDSTTRNREVTDAQIVKALPDELKSKIQAKLGSLPSELTMDWMLNNLMARICLGDSKEVQTFLDALIAASDGQLRRAAAVGDMFDMLFMEPDKELPAEYIVEEVIYSGLVRTKTGEVLLKAVVA